MTTGRPLVVVEDDTLLDEVLRMAAAAGCAVDHAPDLVGARPKWSTAALVIVGENEAMSEHGLPPRRGVALVCKASRSSAVWSGSTCCPRTKPR
jgi:hypothetical protein